MKPRKRIFKQNDKLKLAYIVDHPEFGSDFIGTTPNGRPRADLYYLFYSLLRTPIGEKKWDPEKESFVFPPSFIEELESRGYDPKTIYFEIEKKK